MNGTITANVIGKAKGMAAHEWWQQWGRGTPALRFVAMRALAQTVSASCSEQAWSEYDFVHSRRRNALKKGYASMLVRGHNYARLIRRLKRWIMNQAELLGPTVRTRARVNNNGYVNKMQRHTIYLHNDTSVYNNTQPLLWLQHTINFNLLMVATSCSLLIVEFRTSAQFSTSTTPVFSTSTQ
jgi:hypothetical protein